MTDKQKERITKLGLKISDFEPRNTEEEQTNNADTDARLTEIEDALIELAEIISEVM